jgi:RNA polymerase sigma factor (sigma-70 family)
MRTDSTSLPEPRRRLPEPPRPPQPVRHERLTVLLVAAREGDRSALDELVRELTPLLWQVVRSQGLDQDRGADVVQSTWMALVASLAEIRRPQALLSWLITAARREAWRVQAKHRVEQSTDIEAFLDLPDPDALPEHQLLDDERRTRLWAAVARLSPRCQQLLRIVACVERPDYGEVSTALGMPRGSIGPTRGRCLAKLRQLLGVDQPEGKPCQP